MGLYGFRLWRSRSTLSGLSQANPCLRIWAAMVSFAVSSAASAAEKNLMPTPSQLIVGMSAVAKPRQSEKRPGFIFIAVFF